MQLLFICTESFCFLLQAHNGLHHLVVCKGPSVIIFSISVKDGILIQKPQHKIIQGLHRMPITGLACTHNGTAFTSSLDGSVQTLTVGNDVIIFIKCRWSWIGCVAVLFEATCIHVIMHGYGESLEFVGIPVHPASSERHKARANDENKIRLYNALRAHILYVLLI